MAHIHWKSPRIRTESVNKVNITAHNVYLACACAHRGINMFNIDQRNWNKKVQVHLIYVSQLISQHDQTRYHLALRVHTALYKLAHR